MLGDSHFPNDFKISKIVLIPKKSSPTNIRNWRPISLSNSIYKIYTKVIAQRLATTLPTVLGSEQKAYVKTQNISEATMNIVEYLAELNNPDTRPINGNSFLVAIDWKKAFDSLNHDFILKTLRYFKFPETFVSIINKWLSCRRSSIIVDGIPSEFFDVLRGIPQGDAISGYIFILCMEIIIIKLRIMSHQHLKPILRGGTRPSANECFADDLMSIIDGSVDSLSNFKSTKESKEILWNPKNKEP